MPYTKRQIKRILDEEGNPIIALGRADNLALRVTESLLRRLLYSWEDRAVGRQWDLFNAAFNDIRSYATLLADQMGITTFGRSADVLMWKRGVMNTARTILQRAMDATAQEGLRSALTAYYVGYYGGAWQLDMVTPPDKRVNAPTPSNFDAHKAVLMPGLSEQVLPDQTLYDLLGVEFRQAHADELAEMLVKVNRALDTGIAGGEGYQTIFRRVRDAMGIQTDRRQGFTANFHRVQTLTRTAIMTSSNAGNMAVYQQNRDIVQGIEFLASNDGRTCKLCGSLDGTRWPFGDPAMRIPPRDTHPSCRCTPLAWLMENILIASDLPPAMTWQEWLLAFGGGLMVADYFDEFFDGDYESTQV